jgi:hypothetical protein
MKRHLKFVLYLVAIALVAVLILDLKKGVAYYDKAPSLKKIAEAELLGIKVLDIFLGVLGLAFVATAAGYVASLVKGGRGRKALAAEAEAGEGVVPAAEVPQKKLLLEKALGRKGAKILGVLVTTILILVIVGALVIVAFLLFPGKLPFLQELFTTAWF